MPELAVGGIHLAEDLVGTAHQLAGVAVDELQLHLHADRRPGAGDEFDVRHG
jgi:hypothetical protein